MNFANLKISARLSAGFGILIVLMLTVIGISIGRFASIGDINRQIIEQDLVSVNAAHNIDEAAREDARRTLALFILPDKAARAKSYERIDQDKKAIDAALEKLNRLARSDADRAQIGKVQESRSAYAKSFIKAAELLEEDKRDDASKLMNEETFPALDKLLGDIKQLVDQQQKEVEISGTLAKQDTDTSRLLMIALGIAAAAAGVWLSLWITASITRPLNEAVAVAKRVADGDLTTRIEAKTKDETGQLLQALKDMNDSLGRTVSQVRVATDSIATASGEIASGNADLSSRTESQASSLEETAASMEQITSTVKQNAENAAQANEVASQASLVARRGGQVVTDVVATMEAINDSARKIVDIIGVIDGIAFQTNILALNAAVEAARAGEQGRGFAVVAGEVRTLAQRSAAAAKEIKQLIGESVERIEAGNRLVSQAGASMDDILASVQRVSGIVSEIVVASREQASGIHQVNDVIAHLDDTTQQNSALVEQAAAAAASLDEQARNLARTVSVFRTGDDRTLRLAA